MNKSKNQKPENRKMATKTTAQLKAEIKDLGERLYYCSNSGEGRKMRREIEKAIRQKEQEIFTIDTLTANYC
jgi:hypothetical protein